MRAASVTTNGRLLRERFLSASISDSVALKVFSIAEIEEYFFTLLLDNSHGGTPIILG